MEKEKQEKKPEPLNKPENPVKTLPLEEKGLGKLQEEFLKKSTEKIKKEKQ